MLSESRKLAIAFAMVIIAAVAIEVIPFGILKWHEYAFERDCEVTCRASGKAARISPLNQNAIVRPGQVAAAWRCTCV